jgi:hypothetical protein
MSTELFRTCPESGLQFHKPAERLMKAHAVVAVVILLLGGISALLVTLTRWPAVHLLPADRFYQLLTTHGVNMLIFWMISFEIAILYFCSSTLLMVRLSTLTVSPFGRIEPRPLQQRRTSLSAMVCRSTRHRHPAPRGSRVFRCRGRTRRSHSLGVGTRSGSASPRRVPVESEMFYGQGGPQA